jgi:hypothetical protein
MGLAALTVDEMISGFPNPVLPLITAEPTLEDIMNTQHLLNANFISIPSIIGGGMHGHHGLSMMVQEYAAISPTHFGVAVDPWPIAQVNVGMEAVEAFSLVRLHDELKRAHVTRLNCDEACKKPVLASYTNMSNEALGDYLLGYANVTPLDLLVYLRLTYGHIAPTQLADCYNKMTTPYDMQDPIDCAISEGVTHQYTISEGAQTCQPIRRRPHIGSQSV